MEPAMILPCAPAWQNHHNITTKVSLLTYKTGFLLKNRTDGSVNTFSIVPATPFYEISIKNFSNLVKQKS